MGQSQSLCCAPRDAESGGYGHLPGRRNMLQGKPPRGPRSYIDHVEKQRGFETDFKLDADAYEVWDELEIGRTAKGAQTFVVKEEDILAWNLSTSEDDPLFVDPAAARAEGHEHLVAHPLFAVQIAFYCVEKGTGNWLRSPGASPARESAAIRCR